MAIKKLQNNFTTPEQSKRLLELGVPADSADCYTTTNNGRAVVLNLLFSEFMKNVVAGGFNNPDAYLPCWSVGRLMEVCKICGSYELTKEIYRRTLMYLNTIDGCICEMSHEINIGNLDLSKLED